MPLPPLGLYIHLPWCERKCPYCDFNSHETDNRPEALYIQTLLRDLSNDLHLLQGRPVETVFIGGGTPSLFSVAAIQTLLKGVAGLVTITSPSEITMEANPGSADAEKFLALKDAGVNRLSLGIQSFDDRQLQTLGRLHSSDQANAAIDYAQAAGFQSINLDLMHGLPQQTLASAAADLERAAAFQPSHLSWYQLTVEPNTQFYKRPPLLPDEEILADIQLCGEQLLQQKGYTQYEVSAYSQSGFHCQHNSNYWSFGDYLGIGAGAHSKVSFPDGRITRYAKRRQPQEYMVAGDDAFVAHTRTLQQNEIVGEFIMNALRLNSGFTLSQFTARTGLSQAHLEPQLGSLCQRALLQCKRDVVTTTATGRQFLDTVIAEFFPD